MTKKLTIREYIAQKENYTPVTFRGDDMTIMPYLKWSKEEIEKLKEQYHIVDTISQLCLHLPSKTIPSIKSKIKQMLRAGVIERRIWR
jgi:hypothetical protein